MSGSVTQAKPRSVPTLDRNENVRWMQEVCSAEGKKLVPVANDVLYDDLELRYGPGFAQWVVDGLNK